MFYVKQLISEIVDLEKTVTTITSFSFMEDGWKSDLVVFGDMSVHQVMQVKWRHTMTGHVTQAHSKVFTGLGSIAVRSVL